LEITSLTVYPIKSCRGIALGEAVVTRRGLASDRLWMVVDEDGKFLTQRDTPGLTHVATRFDGDAVVVSAPGTAELRLPLRFDGPRIAVEVWRHRGDGARHEAGSAWFSAVLGRPASLVRMPDDVDRAVNPAFGRPGDVVSFADGYPILLITEESLAGLQARVAEPLSMRRFRPNVVVRGAPSAHDEDAWRRITLGAAALRVAKRCDRCVMTTIDPETGARGKEPLRTLAWYRTERGAVYFGVYLMPDGDGAVVRAGDEVQVVERGGGG